LSFCQKFEIQSIFVLIIWILDLRACFEFRVSNFGFIDNHMAEKILIVDDETDMLVLLRMIIQEQTPHEPVTTPNPLEVMPILAEKEIALVIADLRMPGLDGFHLLEMIRAKYPLIPVIIITAYDSPETAEEALRKGAFDYIPKPFRRERIIQAIEQGLAHRRSSPTPV
jgi:DNA-binding NtrC family response regulator